MIPYLAAVLLTLQLSIRDGYLGRFSTFYMFLEGAVYDAHNDAWVVLTDIYEKPSTWRFTGLPAVGFW